MQEQDIPQANLTGAAAGSTERTASQERAMAEKYLQIAAVMILALDTEGRVTLINQKGCELLGYSEEELLGHSWFDQCLPERLRQSTRDLFSEMVDGNLDLYGYVEGRVLTASGEERLIAWNNTALTDERGNMTGTLSSGEDITDRRRAENALRTSEEAFRELIDNIPAVMWKADLDGNTVYVSANIESVLGFTPEEVYAGGREMWMDRVSPDDVRTIVDSWVALQSEGTPYDQEYRIKRKDGEWIWIHARAQKMEQANHTFLSGVFSDVTQRKLAEEGLIESEAKYRQLFSTDSDAILLMDFDSLDIVDVNESALKMFQYSREEFLKLSIEDVSAEKEKTLAAIEGVRLGNLSTVPLRYYRKKDGTAFPVEISPRVFPLKGSEVICIMIRDLSARLAAEEARRQSEEKLESIALAAKDAIIMTDGFGKVLFWNPAAERIFGYTTGEAMGENIWELIFSDPDHEASRERVLAFGRTGRDEVVGMTSEQQFRRKSGELFPAELALTALQIDGRWHSISLVRDITKRKRAEQTLKHSEHKYRTLVERALEGITIVQDGIIVFANPGLGKILGCLPEDLLGKSYAEIIHPDELLTVRKHYESRMAGRPAPNTYASAVKHTDGHKIKIEISGAVITYEDRPADLVSIRDVHEIARLRELESRAKRLEAAGQVAGQVAHDFNNLLGPLMAYPGIARDELPQDHPVLEYLDEIEKSARQIAEINQQLLTLGRRGHYNQQPLNLNEVIRDVVRDLGTVPSTLVVDAELDENIFNVIGGRAQIHRALSNLIVNARDAMQDIGQVVISTENVYIDADSIDYGSVPRGEYVLVTVSDTGTGISDEIVQKIFDPFFSTKTADKKRGSGLGLSVVDAVVKDHSGHLDLRSAAGQGTSFLLYFPITREATQPSEIFKVVGGNEKILVVDDDEVQRKVLINLLKKLGYHAQAVESGEAAIECLAREPYDLAILDMVMSPGIDGAETYRRLLEINPGQKALIVSGFAESGRVQEAQRLGAGPYIRKPLTRETLAVALRRELEREVLIPR